MFIKHNRCPDCGARIKHYYWYCGSCNNHNLTDWRMTALMVVIMVAIVAVAALFIKSALCRAELFHPILMNYGISC